MRRIWIAATALIASLGLAFAQEKMQPGEKTGAGCGCPMAGMKAEEGESSGTARRGMMRGGMMQQMMDDMKRMMQDMQGMVQRMRNMMARCEQMMKEHGMMREEGRGPAAKERQ